MKASKRTLLFVAVSVVSLIGVSGCLASFLRDDYADKAERLHPLVSQKGASRTTVLKAFGPPDTTYGENANKVDTYLAPNDTWIEKSESKRTQLGSCGPNLDCFVFVSVLASAFEVVIDPMWSMVVAVEGRDATKCEYVITYNKDDHVSNVEVRYPRGFPQNVCGSHAASPR